MKFYYIYKTTNLLNGKLYIGKHESLNKNDEYLGSGKLLSRAIEKYGRENFNKDVIEYCENSVILNDREKYWIEELNTFYPAGYNIAKGGEGGDLISKNPNRLQICQDIKERLLKRYENETDKEKQERISKLKGKKRSKEVRKNISKGKTGIKFSDEHRANISKSCVEYMKVIPRYNQKKVNCYSSEGIFIKELDSIAEVGRQFGKNTRDICSMCKHDGVYRKIKDYIFKYSDGTTDNISPLITEKKKRVYRIYTCPYCGVSGKGQGMSKYHFENCKNNV